MKITLISSSAAKPATKKAKIPNSIQYLADKGKFRIKSATPGHYVLSGSRAKFKMIAIVRFKEETRFTPSMGTKAFTATASQVLPISVGVYDEPMHELEAEAAAKAPGARSNVAGQKMGKKTRAPNMLAPGWWMFIRDKDNKVTKEYIGPRISARRLMDIVSGEPAKAETAKKAPAKTAKAEPAKKTTKKDPVEPITVKYIKGKDVFHIYRGDEFLTGLKKGQKAVSTRRLKSKGVSDSEIADVLETMTAKTKKPAAAKNAKAPGKLDLSPKAKAKVDEYKRSLELRKSDPVTKYIASSNLMSHEMFREGDIPMAQRRAEVARYAKHPDVKAYLALPSRKTLLNDLAEELGNAAFKTAIEKFHTPKVRSDVKERARKVVEATLKELGTKLFV